MRTRTKGVAFEREVAQAFEAAGFTVRGLESGGDLWCHKNGRITHVECKRQERLKVPEWLRQLARDTPQPPTTEAVLVFKQSRQPAYAVMPLEQYLARVRDA
jgi:Holliday junction resolvase